MSFVGKYIQHHGGMNRAWKTPRTGGVKRTQSTASKHCCTGVPPGQSSNLQDFKFAHVAGKQTWLVVLTILKHMSSSMRRMIPYIMETKMFERILIAWTQCSNSQLASLLDKHVTFRYQWNSWRTTLRSNCSRFHLVTAKKKEGRPWVHKTSVFSCFLGISPNRCNVGPPR